MKDLDTSSSSPSSCQHFSAVIPTAPSPSDFATVAFNIFLGEKVRPISAQDRQTANVTRLVNRCRKALNLTLLNADADLAKVFTSNCRLYLVISQGAIELGDHLMDSFFALYQRLNDDTITESIRAELIEDLKRAKLPLNSTALGVKIGHCNGDNYSAGRYIADPVISYYPIQDPRRIGRNSAEIFEEGVFALADEHRLDPAHEFFRLIDTRGVTPVSNMPFYKGILAKMASASCATIDALASKTRECKRRLTAEETTEILERIQTADPADDNYEFVNGADIDYISASDDLSAGVPIEKDPFVLSTLNIHLEHLEEPSPQSLKRIASKLIKNFIKIKHKLQLTGLDLLLVGTQKYTTMVYLVHFCQQYLSSVCSDAKVHLHVLADGHANVLITALLDAPVEIHSAISVDNGSIMDYSHNSDRYFAILNFLEGQSQLQGAKYCLLGNLVALYVIATRLTFRLLDYYERNPRKVTTFSVVMYADEGVMCDEMQICSQSQDDSVPIRNRSDDCCRQLCKVTSEARYEVINSLITSFKEVIQDDYNSWQLRTSCTAWLNALSIFFPNIDIEDDVFICRKEGNIPLEFYGVSFLVKVTDFKLPESLALAKPKISGMHACIVCICI
jgi:hypothetical protein